MFSKFPTVIVFISMFVCSALAQSQQLQKGVKPVKTQMHIHALSNHNGAVQPASMQYHNQYADTFNTDVVWWAEHYDLFRQKDMIFDFVGGTVDANFNITGLNGSTSEIDYWEASYTSSNIISSITDSSLEMKINGAGSVPFPREFSYVPKGTKGKLTNVDKYIKSVTSLPVFEFYLTPYDLLNTKSSLQILFNLSWHIDGPHETQDLLICNFVDSSQTASKYLIGTDTVVVNIPVFNNVAQKISIPIADQLYLLSDSTDNVIQGYELRIESYDGNPVGAKFDRMKIYVADPSDTINFNSVLKLMDTYEQKFGKKNYMGIEFTGSHGTYDHITAHLPFKPKFSDIIVKGITTSEHQEYVDHIHKLGGITTYTHPYGSTHGPLYSASVMDYREDTLLSYLISNNNAFDCDLIEVGYKLRGHADLDHHLGLWDRLTASGRFMYGVGTNDLHGDPWNNYYLSWIWSSDDSPANLISALKKGRFYFGVAEMWDGYFDFTVGDQQMGDRALGIYTAAEVHAYMSPQLPGMKLKITQGLIDTTSLTVNYLLHDSVININQGFKVDLTQPSFIRLSVFDSLGKPVVFSNPVVYLSSGSLPNTKNNDHVSLRNALQIEVSPNPVADKAMVKLSNCKTGMIDVEITDVAGTFKQQILKKKISSDVFEFPVNLSGLLPGIYMIKVTQNSEQFSTRIIKG